MVLRAEIGKQCNERFCHREPMRAIPPTPTSRGFAKEGLSGVVLEQDGLNGHESFEQSIEIADHAYVPRRRRRRYLPQAESARPLAGVAGVGREGAGRSA